MIRMAAAADGIPATVDDNFLKVPIPNDGWCLWITIDKGVKAVENKAAIDAIMNNSGLNDEAKKEQIKSILKLGKKEKDASDKVVGTPDFLQSNKDARKLATIVANKMRGIPTSNTRYAGIQNEIDDGNLKTRDGEPITTFGSYLTGISALVDPKEEASGPKVLPDIMEIQTTLKEIYPGIRFIIYNPTGIKPGLMDNIRDPGIKRVYILHNGTTHFDLLVQKGGATPAAAATVPAAIAAPAPTPPAAAAAAAAGTGLAAAGAAGTAGIVVPPPPVPAPGTAPAQTPVPAGANPSTPLPPNVGAAPPLKRSSTQLGPMKKALTNARARALAAAPKATSQRVAEAMKAARKRSAQAMANAKAGLTRGTSKVRKLIYTGSLDGEVIVAGERVRIEEDGFRPDAHYDVVSFRSKYFPNRQMDDLLELEKATFQQIFGEASEMSNIDNPLPPCNKATRDTLLEGLKNRFESLRKDTIELYELKGDDVAVRGSLDHLHRLKIYIDHLEKKTEEGSCYDYESAVAETKVDVGEEDEIRALLRQFAFMILQSKVAVEEYKDMNPAVKEVMETLKENQISEEELNAYFEVWKEQAAALDSPEKLPSIIAEVLDATSTQRGMLDMMLDDRLNALLNAIVNAVRGDYNASDTEHGTKLETEFNDFLVAEDILAGTGRSMQEKVLALVKWIAQKNSEAWRQLKECQQNVVKLNQTIDDLHQEIVRLEGRVAAAAAAAATAEENLETATKKIGELTGELEGKKVELASAVAAAATAAEEAAADLNAAKEAKDAVEVALEETRAKLTDALAETATSEAKAVTALAAQEATAEELAYAKETIEQLQATITQLTSDKTRLQEALAAAEEAKGVATAEAAAMTAELESLRSSATQSDKQVAESAARIAALETELATANATVTTKEEEVNTIQGRLAECNEGLTRKGEELAAAIQEKEAAVAAANKKVEEAKAAQATAEGYKSGLEAKISEQRRNIVNSEQRVEAGKNIIKGIQEELAIAVAAAAVATAALAKGDATKQAEVNRITTRVAQLNEQLEAAAAEKGRLVSNHTSALAAQAGTIENIRKELNEANNRISQLEADLSKRGAELADLQTAAKAAEAAAAVAGQAAEEKAAGDVDAFEQEIARIFSEKKALERAAAEANAEKKGLEELLKAAETGKRAAEADVVTSRTTAEKAARTAEEAAQTQLNQFSDQLRGLAEGILKGDSTLPDGINRDVSPAFNELLNAISKSKLGEETKAFDTATYVCFMTYFITFFVKALFFSKGNRDEKKALYDGLDQYVTALLAGARNAGIEGEDRNVLFKLLATCFHLLYTGETLFVNKQGHLDSASDGPFVGLYVLKRDEAAPAEKEERNKLVGAIMDTWVDSSIDRGAVIIAVEQVFSNLLLDLPSIHFNPPIPETDDFDPPVLGLLSEYPSMTYRPTVDARVEEGKFIEVDMDNGFTLKEHPIADRLPVRAHVARFLWPKAVDDVNDTRLLQYRNLFCIFIALGRRYLTTLEENDLKKFKCPLPALLKSPASAMEEPGTAAVPPPVLAAPPPAPTPATPAGTVIDVQSLPKITGGDGTQREKTHPEIIYAILDQLKSGATVPKESLSDIINQTSSGKKVLPIYNFIFGRDYYGSQTINKEGGYGRESQTFKDGIKGEEYLTFEKVNTEKDRTTPKYKNKVFMWNLVHTLETTGTKNPWQPVGYTETFIGGNFNFLRKFILDFFKAYVQQYSFADTIDDRITILLPIFKENLNPMITYIKKKGDNSFIGEDRVGGPSNLFTILRLTDDLFTNYTKNQYEQPEIAGLRAQLTKLFDSMPMVKVSEITSRFGR